MARQEVTVGQAASDHRVDRPTITRIREVAKQGALSALAASKPGDSGKARDYELDQARAEVARLSEALKEMTVRPDAGRGRRQLGLTGRVLLRVPTATNTGRPELLELLDTALEFGWSMRDACRTLELGRRRADLWLPAARPARSPTLNPAVGRCAESWTRSARRSWPCSRSGAG